MNQKNFGWRVYFQKPLLWAFDSGDLLCGLMVLFQEHFNCPVIPQDIILMHDMRRSLYLNSLDIRKKLLEPIREAVE
jgi:hypothetical protein